MASRKNLHVPIDPDVHARLVAQARRVRSPVTVVAREAIEAWIAELERRARFDAIRAYAEATAGSEADLDEVLAEAAVESLAEVER